MSKESVRITGSQIEDARLLLGWDYEMLAQRSGQSVMIVARIERNSSIGNLDVSRTAIREAFEAAGVEFTNGDRPAARLKA